MFELIIAFATSIFISLNWGALLYVNSSYLSHYFSTDGVSFIFMLAAIFSIALFFLIPWLVNTFGKEKLFPLFILASIFGALGLALGLTPHEAALAFILYESFLFLTYYCLDIFVEERSQDKTTGQIRGLYLTFLNMGIAGGPLLITLLVNENNFQPLFLAAASILIIPGIFSFFLFFSRKKGIAIKKHEKIELPWKQFWFWRNIRAVVFTRFALEAFFAAMVIYTPIYLYKVIGFSWTDLGIMFTVMLLPFIFLEWPAGRIADKTLGEKELMSLGLFIMGLSLLVMPFLGKEFHAWTIILFLSRVGASLVEVMTETYFFKKVTSRDTGLISIFNLSRPVGVILGTAIGIIMFDYFSMEKIFFAFAIIVFLAMRESLYLVDTL